MPRPRKAINQINVVPYIDVMLVLLIIFMVTAPLITPGEITLPSVGSALTPPSSPINITLNTDQSLQLKEGSASAIRVSREELIARLRELQSKNADQSVVIAANKSARYEDVISLIDLLQRNGIRKVGLLARQQSG